jgi:uncharacterized membrane protein
VAKTLTNGSTVLTLPADLLWVDEFDWNPVQSSEPTFSVDGAQLIDSGLKLAGRPITLEGGAEFGWATRATALTLHQWVQQVQPTLTLSINGTTYSVAFAHHAQPLQVTPVVPYSDPQDVDFVSMTLRFITL